MKSIRIHAAKPKRCTHCDQEVKPGEVFGSEGRWLHRSCVSRGPMGEVKPRLVEAAPIAPALGLMTSLLGSPSGGQEARELMTSAPSVISAPAPVQAPSTPQMPRAPVKVSREEIQARVRAQKFHKLVASTAKAVGLDPALLDAVIWTESKYNPDATNASGAVGLMQMTPITRREMRLDDASQPVAAVRAGALYLKRLLARFDGDIDKALAAYNAGPGNVLKHGGVPPFPETQAYVKRVKERMSSSPFAKQGSATPMSRHGAHHLKQPWHDHDGCDMGDSDGVEVEADSHSADFHKVAPPTPRQAQEHPHTSVPEPPVKQHTNEQTVAPGQAAGDVYRDIAKDYGTLTPGKPANLKFYDYRPHEQAVDDLIKQHGYNVYYAGGKYGKPDLANRNYTTGHLMVYDPTPGEGGDFGDEAYTRSWRKIHELSHGTTLDELNKKYGEGRRIGKLGTHRTLREAKRAVEWEWLAAHKQRELSTKLGHPIDDKTFAKELNTVMHDAVHRAITGKFTNPDEEGFEPSDHIIPLEVSLGKLERAAKKMGLRGEDDLLPRGGKTSSRVNVHTAAGDVVDLSQRRLQRMVDNGSLWDDSESNPLGDVSTTVTEGLATPIKVRDGERYITSRALKVTAPGLPETGAAKTSVMPPGSAIHLLAQDIAGFAWLNDEKGRRWTVPSHELIGLKQANRRVAAGLTVFNRLKVGDRFINVSGEKKTMAQKTDETHARVNGVIVSVDPHTRVIALVGKTADEQQLDQETGTAPTSSTSAPAPAPVVPKSPAVKVRRPPREHEIPLMFQRDIQEEKKNRQPVTHPGVPAGTVYDPTTNKIYDASGNELDPEEYKLNPKKPFEPQFAGAHNRDYWQAMFRGALSDADRAHLEHLRHDSKAQATERAKLKQRKEQVKKLLAKQMGAPLKASDERKLAEYQKDVQELTDKYDEGLHNPERDIPEKTTVRYGKDLIMTRNDATNEDVGVENILKVFAASRPDEISYWKDWYIYARDDVKALADKYKLPEQVVAAIVAAVSPNVRWEKNIHAAEQLIRGRGRKVIEYRKRLSDLAAMQLLPRLFPDLYLERETLDGRIYLANITKGQRILDDYRKTKKWDVEPGEKKRLEWDPHNPKSLDKARKEFQELLDKGYTAYYTKSPTNWTRTTKKMDEFDPAARRTFMIPVLGDPDTAPKVTAFYESIMLPERTQDKVVLDGHAQNIFYGQPRTLSDLKRSITDEKWDTMIAAYKKAAKMAGPILKQKVAELKAAAKATDSPQEKEALLAEAKRLSEVKKITPQQMQAITWSVWRGAIPKKLQNLDEEGAKTEGDEDQYGGGDELPEEVTSKKASLFGYYWSEIEPEPEPISVTRVVRVAAGPVGIREMERLVGGPHSFGIVSAYRQPKGEEPNIPKHKNQSAHGELMRELQMRGYAPGQIRELRGHWGGKAEQSYIVMGMTFEDAIELGRKFGQDAVIWKGPDGVAAMYNTLPGQETASIARGSEAGRPKLEMKPKDEKEHRRGPPSPSEHVSKANSTSFQLDFDFDNPVPYHGQPITKRLLDTVQMERSIPTEPSTELPTETPPRQANREFAGAYASRSPIFSRVQ